MKKLLKKAMPVILLASMLAGCSFGGDKDAKKNEVSTLKVMYYDEGQFFQHYGMLFSAIYPNVDIQVVSTQELYNNQGGAEGEEFDPEKKKKELIEREKPDLIMMDIKDYGKAAEEGTLLDLSSYMTKDKFQTEGLIPGMLDHMKELGGGQLYGLPSSVSSQVLFYNKDLFDKHNIEYPTDQMTWSEVLHLAKQFPTDGKPEERIYGLKVGYSGDLHQLSSALASSEGLKFVDAATKKMSINTTGWEKAVQTAVDAIKSKSMYVDNQENNMMGSNFSYEDHLLRDPFISGRLAMSIDGNYILSQINEATNYIKEEGRVVKNWDVVTVPVSEQFPDESSNTWYDPIFGIAKDSPNADAAWQFISYVSSEEYARVKAKTPNYNGFPIHTKYIKDEEGRNFAAFYKLKPSKNSSSLEYDRLPKAFNEGFYDMMRQELKEVEDGKKEIKEALEIIQIKGEELLSVPDKDEKKAAEGTAGAATTEEVAPSPEATTTTE
ncbi:ABC transporter substrate-binding protein [Paenibacillus sp. L3-i20]|uniref:ABC transporter substrate-binding protein n=1 Tax=Paenibacillus sp. L3-i20 TaxID=2905833 RepID=UPI001EE02899|nr:extracellular solute-binding protein [Paenibacillus sp. L3-i20]GKU80113.1 sugar ABC transporter substrate-binding protein [Paenibacillus sp. L3-i20]